MFHAFIHEWFTSLFHSWSSPAPQSYNVPSALLKCTLHFCLNWSLAISHPFWGETQRAVKKNPSNRSRKTPISRSTICPSNDYLGTLWCDTVGWRGSGANILSLTQFYQTLHNRWHMIRPLLSEYLKIYCDILIQPRTSPSSENICSLKVTVYFRFL